MSRIDWSIVFARTVSAHDSVPISAAPARWVISATCVILGQWRGGNALLFDREEHLLVGWSQLAFESGPQLVLLATPTDAQFRDHTVAWCRFPYGADLLESSIFVPGAHRNSEWRTDKQCEAGSAADPILYLQRHRINLFDTSSDRVTALFGSPRQRYSRLFDHQRRRVQANKIVRMNHIWELRGNHPDLINAGTHGAQQAAEFRWGILPKLSGDRAGIARCEETPDFELARERLLSEPSLLQFREEAESGLLHLGGRRFQLHDAAKDRAADVIAFAAERALCGPHNGAKLSSDRRVSTLARRIAKFELYNQHRRAQGGSSRVMRQSLPSRVCDENARDSLVHARETLEEAIEELRDTFSSGLFSALALLEIANAILEPNVDADNLMAACAALIVLSETGRSSASFAKYVSRLRQLGTEVGQKSTTLMRHAIERACEALQGSIGPAEL